VSKSVSASAGALIVVGLRWTDRLIGLVSTVILARLLAPDDIGIIAMASLVISLIDVLLDMGVNVALIQNKHASRDDYDAAWTLRLIQSLAATVIIFIAAYPAAEYFHDARVTPVVQVLALSILLLGLENIGIVSFQKKMEFGQEFRFFFGKRAGGFLVTILAAWYLHSYWALVIGTLASRVIGVALSYIMHPMRPRLSLVRMRSMLSFSSWNLVRGIGGYLSENLHRWLVGRRENTSIMGSYTYASDIAAMPSTELLAPMNRVLFPMFVAVKDDAQKLKQMVLLAIGVQTLVGIPAGVGLALVAPELVLTMLGAQWMSAVPFVQILGCINVISAISASGGYVLLALGRAKITAFHSWGQVIVFVLLSMLLIPAGGAMAIAEIRLIVAALGLLIFIYLIKREHPSWRFLEFLACIWRPMLASAAMALVLLAVPATPSLPVMAQLLLKSALGALIYSLALTALWLFSGRKDGAEAYLLGKARSVISSKPR
jgi:O-antigen/teichoic acid export membrane protein